jgi:hypothetical protein
MNQTEIYDPIADRILGQENENPNFIYRRRYEILSKITTAIVFVIILDNIWVYRATVTSNFMQDIVWLGFVSWPPIWYINRRHVKHSKIIQYLCVAIPIITIILFAMVNST